MAPSGAPTSPLSASISSFCPLPATPATPRISPARTEKEMSFSATPKSPCLGSERLRAANFSAPKVRPGPLEISFKFPPIISSAMLFEVSLRGSHSATNLPPRSMVAVSQSAMISCNLCDM